MKIKITSDSTCDLSPAQLEQHRISILPLYINLGDKCTLYCLFGRSAVL